VCGVCVVWCVCGVCVVCVCECVVCGVSVCVWCVCLCVCVYVCVCGVCVCVMCVCMWCVCVCIVCGVCSVCVWCVCVCVHKHTRARINLICPLLRIIATERQNRISFSLNMHANIASLVMWSGRDLSLWCYTVHSNTNVLKTIKYM